MAVAAAEIATTAKSAPGLTREVRISGACVGKKQGVHGSDSNVAHLSARWSPVLFEIEWNRSDKRHCR